MEENENGRSEWNQQVSYSDVYFATCKKCREHQSNDDLEMWKFAVQSKFTCALPILDEEQQNQATSLLCDLENFWDEYIKIQLELFENNKSKSGRMDINRNCPQYKNLRFALMQSESGVDILVNKKMPFLNVKKKVDLASW